MSVRSVVRMPLVVGALVLTGCGLGGSDDDPTDIEVSSADIVPGTEAEVSEAPSPAVSEMATESPSALLTYGDVPVEVVAEEVRPLVVDGQPVNVGLAVLGVLDGTGDVVLSVGFEGGSGLSNVQFDSLVASGEIAGNASDIDFTDEVGPPASAETGASALYQRRYTPAEIDARVQKAIDDSRWSLLARARGITAEKLEALSFIGSYSGAASGSLAITVTSLELDGLVGRTTPSAPTPEPSVAPAPAPTSPPREVAPALPPEPAPSPTSTALPGMNFPAITRGLIQVAGSEQDRQHSVGGGTVWASARVFVMPNERDGFRWFGGFSDDPENPPRTGYQPLETIGVTASYTLDGVRFENIQITSQGESWPSNHPWQTAHEGDRSFVGLEGPISFTFSYVNSKGQEENITVETTIEHIREKANEQQVSLLSSRFAQQGPLLTVL